MRRIFIIRRCLALSVLVGLLASATSTGAEPAPKLTFSILPCKNIAASDLSRIIKELLPVRPDPERARLSVDAGSNSLVIMAGAEDMALIREMARSLDSIEDRTVTPTASAIRIFELKRAQIDASVEEALNVVFYNAPNGTKFALDRTRNLVITRGDSNVLMAAEAVLARLDSMVGKPQPPELQVRLVWLVQCGDLNEVLSGPPVDLKDVVQELAKVGIEHLRLGPQFAVNASPDSQFNTQGSVQLEKAVKASIQGEVRNATVEGVKLKLTIAASTEDGKVKGTPILQLNTEITAPLGHAVVLCVTPTTTMNSVFVVQVLPKKSAPPAPVAPKKTAPPKP